MDVFGCDNLFLDYILLSSEQIFRAAGLKPGGVLDSFPMRVVHGLVIHIMSPQLFPLNAFGMLRLTHPLATPSTSHGHNELKDTTVSLQIRPQSSSLWATLVQVMRSPIHLWGLLLSFAPSAPTAPSHRHQNLQRSNGNGRRQRQCVLSNRCASLLCLLLLNKRPLPHHSCSGSAFNAFRECFSLLQDERCGASDANSLAAFSSYSLSLHTDFNSVAAGVSFLSPEIGVVLLYMMLQRHPSYLEAIITAASTENSPCSTSLTLLLDTLLRHCYQISTFTAADVVYVLLIDLLLLVQDSRCPASMASSSSFGWYLERPLQLASYLDVTLLVMLRVLMQTIFRWRGDAYMLSHCFAILLNIQPSVRDIHVYAAERLVRVIAILLKRLLREGERAAILQALHLLLNFVAAVVASKGGSQNIHMLYALIQSHHDLSSLLLDPRLDGSLTGSNSSGSYLLGLAEVYLQELELNYFSVNTNEGTDATKVVKSLRQLIALKPVPPPPTTSHSASFSASIQQFEQEQYSYEEDVEQADTFFVPCAWMATTCPAITASLSVSNGDLNAVEEGMFDIPWVPDRISLFDPTASTMVHAPASAQASDHSSIKEISENDKSSAV